MKILLIPVLINDYGEFIRYSLIYGNWYDLCA